MPQDHSTRHITISLPNMACRKTTPPKTSLSVYQIWHAARPLHQRRHYQSTKYGMPQDHSTKDVTISLPNTACRKTTPPERREMRRGNPPLTLRGPRCFLDNRKILVLFICQGTKMYTQCCHCAPFPCVPRTECWVLQRKYKHNPSV